MRDVINNFLKLCFSRKERLLKIRELFYSCYTTTIGLKFKDGTERSLTTFFGSIAEKVGLSPRM